MNKRIDVSVLPKGFLVEKKDNNDPEKNNFILDRMGQSIETYYLGLGFPLRPALDIWHFNDGSMRLPDGLVVEIKRRKGKDQTLITTSDGGWDVMSFDRKTTQSVFESYPDQPYFEIIAVKILGVTAEYEIDGKRLGMEVIEL